MICLRLAFAFLFACALAVPVGVATAEPAGRYATQLASESDELIRLAIRRPYGWAWDADAASEPPGHPSPHAVSMASRATPAAGLILLWTGKLLGEPRFIEAAENVARGVAAAQMPIGREPSHPLFGAVAGGREPAAAIADRTATRCALGLLLAFADQSQATSQPTLQTADQSPDSHLELLRRSAARCALWLAKQQSANGFWPTAFPPGAITDHTIRVIRLDTPDYRDSTLAVLLAFDLLHDDVLHRFADRPLAGLVKLRLAADVHGPGLWCTACTVGGNDIPAGFPNGPDLLASRFAMQTLMCGYLLTGDASLMPALDQATATLEQVKRPDGLYDRFLDPTAAADVARMLGNQPATQSFFAQPTSKPAGQNPVLSDPTLGGALGIPEVLDAQTQLKSIGRDQFIESLNGGISLHEQIEGALAGLSDDPATLILPKTQQQIAAFLDAHADLWPLAEGPAPDDLAGKVRRLWVLYLRAKLQQLSNAKG